MNVNDEYSIVVYINSILWILYITFYMSTYNITCAKVSFTWCPLSVPLYYSYSIVWLDFSGTLFRSFKKADLCHIKMMFPEVFTFLQEKNIPGMYGTQNYGEYQLTVESTGVVGQAQPSGDASHITILTSCRWKKEFRRRLTCIVVQHHKGWVGEIVTEKKQKKRLKREFLYQFPK